ncbi:hypothetical protein KLP28_01255 [Nocardioidaceae bacterium]|nr:hypothetical protein KLP28_01255 [Nocardioidaceae bacterium]
MAVMVGILMSLIVLAASFAVDLGMQRVLRSDLQALADVAALDAARLLDGRTAGEIRLGTGTPDPLDDVLADSVARNDTTIGDTPELEGRLVRLTEDTLGAVVPVVDGAGNVVEVDDDEVPDAVQVVASGVVGFVFSTARGGAARTSLASATTFACFRIGSFAAALRSGDSSVIGVFNAMISDALGVNLKAVGYDGLLNSSIGLGELATELGAGTAEELAALDALDVGDLFGAYATVLGRNGLVYAQGQMAQLAGQVTSGLTVNLGDILSAGDGSALAGTVNAVDLLGSVALGVKALVSDGNNFLKTGVAWSAPHVANGEIALRAIEAPQQACGPIGSTASTAQVAFNADLSFNLPNKLSLAELASFDVGRPDDITNKAATLHIDASLAGAEGTLVDAKCGAGTAEDSEWIDVLIDTRMLTTNVSLPFRVKGTITTSGASSILPSSSLNSLVSLLFGVVNSVVSVEVQLDLRATARASLTVAPHTATEPTRYEVPPHDYTTVQPSGEGGDPVGVPIPSVSLDLAGSSAKVIVRARLLGLLGGLFESTRETTLVNADLAKLNLDPILSAAGSSIIGTSTAAVVSNVNQALVPVSKMLGVRTAGADLLGVASPECGHPQLVG